MGDFAKAGLDQICFYVLHSVDRRYLDFSSFLVFGHLPHMWTEYLLAQVVELIFSGILGVIFVYLLDIIGIQYLYFKSIVFSTAVWFSAYSIPKIYSIPQLKHMGFHTALSHLLTSAVEGVVVAYVLTRLKRQRTS